jgi:enoyl-CoA hydratase
MTMQDTYDTLLCDRPTAHVLRVTMNRPQVANALNTRMAEDYIALFGALAAAPGDLRCVVLTGAGTRAFCAGGDLKERDGMTDAAWQAQHVLFEAAFQAVMDCPLPVIAAVNGAAFGGGCEFALAADFIHAAESARFALTETSLGIIPGGGGTQNLPRAVGDRRARELIYAAQPFSAQEAADWGLVNRIWPDAELMAGVLTLAMRIAANGPVAVRAAKAAIVGGIGLDLHAGLRAEITAYERTVPTDDRREGVRAFNERRPPRFAGR